MTYEWLPIALPQRFKVADPKDFGVPVEELELSRGSDLVLHVSLGADGVRANEEVAVAGTEWKGSPIALLTQAKHPCVLDGYRRTSTTAFGHTRSQDVGRAASLSITFDTGQPVAIVEWLTNVPALNWTGLTERTDAVTSERRRGGGTTEDRQEGTSTSWDHVELHLKLAKLSMVRIGTVPHELVTEGLRIESPGFIEYHPGPEGLPDEQLRHTVRRAFEFLFGTGLGLLGHSEVDQAGQPLRAVTSSAWLPGDSVERSDRPFCMRTSERALTRPWWPLSCAGTLTSSMTTT